MILFVRAVQHKGEARALLPQTGGLSTMEPADESGKCTSIVIDDEGRNSRRARTAASLPKIVL